MRARRAEIKRPLSESGVDDVKHKNDQIPSPRASQKLFTAVANPKGGNQAPSIRIRCRQHKTQKRPNTKPEGELELISVVANPKGGNQAPSIRIRGQQHKTQKRPNTEPEGDLELISVVASPKGRNQAPSIRICRRHIFRVFSTSYEKRFSIKMTLFQYN